MAEKASLVSPPRPTSSVPSEDAVFHDSGQGPRARALQLLFVIVVVLMVLICSILSIYQGITREQNGGMYFMLGLSLIGFVFVEVVLLHPGFITSKLRSIAFSVLKEKYSGQHKDKNYE